MNKINLYKSEAGQALAEYAVVIGFCIIFVMEVIPEVQDAVNKYVAGFYYLLTLPVP